MLLLLLLLQMEGLLTIRLAGKAADVRRCHSMREALALLDFEDESIADVRDLLVRAMFAPAFLRCNEGRRFLSYLFTLQVRSASTVVKMTCVDTCMSACAHISALPALLWMYWHNQMEAWFQERSDGLCPR